MMDHLKRLEILLGLCRDKIPVHFYRTFENEPFDSCGYCQKPLSSAATIYLVIKYYHDLALQEEIAVCHACSTALKQGYSAESQQTLKNVFNEAHLQRRLDILFATEDLASRCERMLSHCSVCGIPREQVTEFFEYALCEGDEIVFYTQPSFVCVPCTLRIYDSLSAQTKEYKHRFFERHFGFPPPGSEKVSLIGPNPWWLLAG